MKTQIVSLCMITLMLLLGCANGNDETNILAFQNSYVGDNTAVSIVSRHANELDTIEGFKLETNEEPYGINIYYQNEANHFSQDDIQEETVRQAFYLFYFIQNANWLTLHFGEESVTVQRSEFESRMATLDQELNNLEQIEAAISAQLSQ